MKHALIIIIYDRLFNVESIPFAEGPNKFTILTSDKHDVTKLQIGFEGPAQPEVKLVTKKDKTVDVTFITAVGGDYKIHVKYNDNYIHASPYKCKIVGDVKASVDKVKSSGAIKEAKNNADNQITIDGREVGISGTIIDIISHSHTAILASVARNSNKIEHLT
jgi:hypothetical protein